MRRLPRRHEVLHTARAEQRRRIPDRQMLEREASSVRGLLSLGPDLADLYRRSATHVDKILKGSNPAELPMEQPANFELFVNVKTAQVLGLRMPDSILQQATEVIQ
jgi:putative ABC transport system substrate-binding protein